MSDSLYEGVVAFVEGVHYPVDADGNPDVSRPLRWTEEGYRRATKGEPLHNDTHFVREADIPVGGEN